MCWGVSLCCTLFYFISASLPKRVNVSKSSAPSGASTAAPGCETSSMRRSKNSRPQMARGREGQAWSMLTTRYLRSAARAACHLARRFRTNSLPGSNGRRICPPVTVRSSRDGLHPDEVGGACNHRRFVGSARFVSPGRRMDSTAWPNGFVRQRPGWSNGFLFN